MESRDEEEADLRSRDTRVRRGCDRGLCSATGDEYCSGERTLSARVHQGRRSGAAEELALMGLRRVAVDSGWPERQQGGVPRIPQRVHRTRILRDLQEDRRV